MGAAASGPHAYAEVHRAITSWIGQVVLVSFTFAFFLHFCGGIRHLVWDTVRGFELRSIYLGGWEPPREGMPRADILVPTCGYRERKAAK